MRRSSWSIAAHRPGGHWNDAYPFVRLHQPAAFYGVNSRELGQRQKDTVGLNAGLYDLASGAELLAYFDQLMQQRFLPSGRVRFLPMSQVVGEHEVQSLVTGQRRPLRVRRKVVDATHSADAGAVDARRRATASRPACAACR